MTAVLFDLDGTLTESAPGIIACVHFALRGLGHEPDPAVDLPWVVGPPLEDVLARVLAPYGDDRVAAATALYRQRYSSVGLFENALYPGIPEMLAGFTAAGFSLFVATSKRRAFAERILAHFGLADRFAGIYGSEEGGLIDHKPELIAHILTRETLSAEHCVMIGDRSYDIAGAHANGLRAIGVAWGYGAPGELAQAGADAIVDQVGGLLPATRGLLRLD
jgi:phosphoglycolate phosphatase